MPTRRECLAMTANACAALALSPRWVAAQQVSPVIKRPIPSTGEEVPIIGLGSSDSFSRLAGEGNLDGVRAVMQTLFENGGTVFDTAPAYGASEQVAGEAVAALGYKDRVFWATKLNVAGFGGGSADPDAAREQVERSFRRLGREPIDLIQVHNVADLSTQYAILKELKAQGRVRYIGATTTFERQYDTLAQFMRTESPIDFVGIDYAVDNRDVAETLMPMAQDLGIAVMVYQPFGRRRLWSRVEGQEVPEWAREFGAETWAQFFLKFAASHPAVTVVTPATSSPAHMLDDIGAARGRLPDADERMRMANYIDALPET